MGSLDEERKTSSANPLLDNNNEPIKPGTKSVQFVNYTNQKCSVKPEPVKYLTDIIGDTGNFQRCICMFYAITGLFNAFHNIGPTFYAPAQYDFWCAGTNRSVQEQDKCSCSAWEYDDTHFDRTIISEWDLVCDRSWLPSASQSAYQIGGLLGSLVIAPLSDKFGRQYFARVGLIFEVISGFIMYAAPNYWVYAAGRALMSIAAYSRGMTGAIIMGECLGAKSRAFWMQIGCFGWVFGYMAIPWLSYVTRDFRTSLLVITLTEACFLVFLGWMGESPRWLLTKGRFSDAEKLIRKAVKFNGMSEDRLTERIRELEQSMRREIAKSTGGKDQEYGLFNGIKELFGPKARHLRTTILIMYFTHMVHSFVYYGVALNVGQFTLSTKTSRDNLAMFWGFFFQGLVEAPGHIFAVIALQFVGRRKLICALLSGVGTSMVVTIFLQEDGLEWARMACAMSGKFFISSSYAIMFLVTMEIFPTVFRHTAGGTCTAVARIGAITAPFVKEVSETSGFWLALLIFALVSFIDAVMILFVPEMKDEEIPNTVGEAEELDRKERRRSSVALPS